MNDPTTDASAMWLEGETGQRVVNSAPLVGGMSSDVERHRMADGSALVTRHITDREWLAREPYLILSEASALQLLATSAIQVPTFVAADPAAGRLAMSHLPGKMITSDDGLRSRCEAIAALAAELHAIDLPADHDFRPWRPWTPSILKPPVWGTEKLWTAAIEAYESALPRKTTQPVLLHRDLHPLNILWEDDQPALVDWVNACVGHPHAELGHCRWNLTVLVDLDAADAFLAEYLAITDSGSYDPYWDLAPAMGFLPGPLGGAGWHAVGRTDLTPDVVVERTEQFVRSALVAMDSRRPNDDDGPDA